jgi:alkylresorcinol/alkylpyrone synthase
MTATPRLLSLATAVPPYRLSQDDAMSWARAFFADRYPDFARLEPAFGNAGIATRHLCQPVEWYAQPHDWCERTEIYVESALALLESATRAALAQAEVTLDEVDAAVLVSSTGIATPTLDVHLQQRLGMRPDLVRLPIFGLGCAGGAIGLARAAALARAMPGKTVLLLVVELCSQTFRAGDLSKSNVIATALFGDGAAAAIVRADESDAPRLSASGEHTWPDTMDVMGWSVERDGLGVIFSRDIPTLVREKLTPALDSFLAPQNLSRADLGGYIVHPGGAKVLAAMEACFGLGSAALDHARAVLRDYGNMSAPTVLFVLRRALDHGLAGRSVVSALGPGFTVGFQLLEAA